MSTRNIYRDSIMAVVKMPGELPQMKRIKNTLGSFQEIVGGYIETVTFASDLIVICNEEGRWLNLPYNCRILGVEFCGPIILVGSRKDDFCSIPASIDQIRTMIPSMYEI